MGREKLRETIGYAFDCGLAAEALTELCEQYIEERGKKP